MIPNSIGKIVNDKATDITSDLIVGHTYEVVVVAVGADGRRQAIEAAAKNAITIRGKLASPDPCTNLIATGFLNAVSLSWVNPTNYDLYCVEVWRGVTNDVASASMVAEVTGITYIDPIGTSNTTRYYWVRAINSSGVAADFAPDTTAGVTGTTLGVVATDIADFAITATKMFTNTIILSADSWTDHSPSAPAVAWNAHHIVYGGVSYPISAGNTTSVYVYWTIGATSYSVSASHPTLGTTAFMVAINTAGVHTLVWNSSANMVIGTAFIADLAVTTAKIASLAVTEAQIASLSVTEGKIASLAVTEGKIGNLAVTNAKINDLNADKVTAGTFTGLKYRTAAGGAGTYQRIEIDQTAHSLSLYDTANNSIISISNDGSNGYMKIGYYGSNPDFTQFYEGAINFCHHTHNVYQLAGNYFDGAATTQCWGITADGNAFFGSGAISNSGMLTATGLNASSLTGYAIKVDNTKVVGAQGAAVANATDAASVIARLNNLLARLRTHGLIAT